MPSPNFPAEGINKLDGLPFTSYAFKSSEYYGGLGLVPTFGNVYFAGSAASNKADDPANGRRPDRPFATINYAVTQTTASNGDTILVLPGHTETISVAAGL